MCSQSRSVKNERVLNYPNPGAAVSYINERDGPSELLWSQAKVVTVKARKQNTIPCHQVPLPVMFLMSCSQRLQHSQLITFKWTYWSSTCVCLTPSPDRSIKVSILHIRPNNLVSFTPTPLVPVILRGYYSLFHFNINASIPSLVRREWRTQLRRSFGSRSPSVWVQFGVTSSHFSGLLLPSPVRGVSHNHLCNTPFWSLSLCLAFLRPSPEQPQLLQMPSIFTQALLPSHSGCC